MLFDGKSLLTNSFEKFVSKKLYSYADGSPKMENVPDFVQLNLK